uniref:Uncharacterized protein n=1 Tax=Spongospora subterranea TaxID=70186 RepID=A0A0H5QVL1_9EUKA|eukprot:CRZ06028.1 hypothetical protein [Spongospora subterranea]
MMIMVIVSMIVYCVCGQEMHEEVRPVITVDHKARRWFSVHAFNHTISFLTRPNTRWISSSYRSIERQLDGSLNEIGNDLTADSLHMEMWRDETDRELEYCPVVYASLSISGNGQEMVAMLHMKDLSVIHIYPGSYGITREKGQSQHIAARHYGQTVLRDMEHGAVDQAQNRVQLSSLSVMPQSGYASVQHDNCNNKSIKYIQVLIVNDLSRYELLTNVTTFQSSAIVNIADGYYAAASFDTCVRIVLVGQLTFRSVIPEEIEYRSCNTTIDGHNGCVSCHGDGTDCESTSKREDEIDSGTLLSTFRDWNMINHRILVNQDSSDHLMRFTCSQGVDLMAQ